MKAKRFLIMTMATMMVAALPGTSAMAEVTADTTQTTHLDVNTPVAKVHVQGVTVNNRPATPQEKAVAKQMAKQGSKMAKKGVQLAVAAVTNPKKAEKIGQEMEELGNEMERLGDSLETLAEDTTFLYEGDEAEADTMLTAEDFEDISEDFDHAFGWLNSWWGKLLGGGFGLIAGMLGILIAIFVVILVFGILTAPLWIIALVIWLLVRNNRKPSTTAYVNPPLDPVSTTPTENPTSDAAAGADGTAAPTNPRPSYSQAAYVQPYPDENSEMWKSGVMYCCVGVGIILLFLSIGADELWGVGALIACIGVAKLVIASTAKGKKNKQAPTPPQETNTEDYSKSEN